jgi:predicted MFS family arabinose efflux permease
LTVGCLDSPGALLLALALTIFGFGQGMVMAPLSGIVLATVKPTSAGAGSGMYGTTAQIANATGVAAIGAVFLAIESRDRISRLRAARIVCVACDVRALDCDQCRISDVDASRCGLNASRFM